MHSAAHVRTWEPTFILPVPTFPKSPMLADFTSSVLIAAVRFFPFLVSLNSRHHNIKTLDGTDPQASNSHHTP